MLTSTFASRNNEKIVAMRNISSITYIIKDWSKQLDAWKLSNESNFSA